MGGRERVAVGGAPPEGRHAGPVDTLAGRL